VIFHRVIHSSRTGEAICDEQAEPSQGTNGHS
jgi:hypothetical protein